MVVSTGAGPLKSSGLITCLECTSDKNLPMFLPSLNEINGGCENIMPATGVILKQFKVFRMMDFTAWL